MVRVLRVPSKRRWADWTTGRYKIELAPPSDGPGPGVALINGHTSQCSDQKADGNDEDTLLGGAQHSFWPLQLHLNNNAIRTMKVPVSPSPATSTAQEGQAMDLNTFADRSTS